MSRAGKEKHEAEARSRRGMPIVECRPDECSDKARDGNAGEHHIERDHACSSANFRGCAWLLNGMLTFPILKDQCQAGRRTMRSARSVSGALEGSVRAEP